MLGHFELLTSYTLAFIKEHRWAALAEVECCELEAFLTNIRTTELIPILAVAQY